MVGSGQGGEEAGRTDGAESRGAVALVGDAIHAFPPDLGQVRSVYACGKTRMHKIGVQFGEVSGLVLVAALRGFLRFFKGERGGVQVGIDDELCDGCFLGGDTRRGVMERKRARGVVTRRSTAVINVCVCEGSALVLWRHDVLHVGGSRVPRGCLGIPCARTDSITPSHALNVPSSCFFHSFGSLFAWAR